MPESVGQIPRGLISNLQVMPLRAPQPPAPAPTEGSD